VFERERERSERTDREWVRERGKDSKHVFEKEIDRGRSYIEEREQREREREDDGNRERELACVREGERRREEREKEKERER
jgi:hypothetical protein